MQKRTLGKTNLSVSVLGFGAATIAYLGIERRRSAAVIETLLLAGVNLIDTAASYPGSEEFIGEAFAARRDQFYLVSKCGQKIPESSGEAWSAKTVSAALDRSLKRLRTDHLDVMLLHSCKLAVLEKGEAMGALVKAKQAGKTRYIGYSGDNDAAVFAANISEVDVIQMSISIADQFNIDHALPIARRNNVGVIAKRPLANAAWKGSEKLPGMYREYAAPYIERFNKMQITPTSLGFKGDWAELALRFTLSQAGVHTAIVGTTNPDSAARNIANADAPALAEDVLQKIRDAFRDADSSGKWKGET